jgi:hypothetical protein
MDMVYCPGCACHLCDSKAACPVCGAPRAAASAPRTARNPFKLIASCVVWAIVFWFGFLLVGGEPLAGSLLLTSIGMSITLTVRGILPGTRKLAGGTPPA